MNKQVILHPLRKGFTLVELLIVIAVLGILSAVILVAIDPIDKINAANDAKVNQDMAAIAKAAEVYAVNNGGNYPQTLAVLAAANTGELRSVPRAPTGYDAATCGTNYGYTVDANPATTFSLTCLQKGKKLGASKYRRYESTTGKMCNVTTNGGTTAGCL